METFYRLTIYKRGNQKMKKTMVATALMTYAQFSIAHIRPALIEEIPQSQIASLEATLHADAESLTGFQHKGFKVKWNDIKNCIEVRSEADPSKLMGTCVVGFKSFQV